MSVETTEYLAMLRRLIRAAGRRVADADEVELAGLLSIQQDLDQAIRHAVDGQRALGKSWSAIASAAGTTKQAAHARWNAG